MSFIPLNNLKTSIETLAMSIEDLENQKNTMMYEIDEFIEKLEIWKKKLGLVNKKIMTKHTMKNDLTHILSQREEKIDKDQDMLNKIIYTIKCKEFLKKNSSITYNFTTMMVDEMIECAHKLHIIKCLKKMGELYFPINEHYFFHFEMIHYQEECIFLNSQCAIPIEEWHQLFLYNNNLSFSIYTSVHTFKSIVYNHQTNSSKVTSSPSSV